MVVALETGRKEMTIQIITKMLKQIYTSNLMSSEYPNKKIQEASISNRPCFKKYRLRISIKQWLFTVAKVITQQSKKV